MTQTLTAPGAPTTEPFGVASEFVLLGGQRIGEISGSGGLYIAQPQGARFGTYWFASREAAIEACVSYRHRGYWTGERR